MGKWQIGSLEIYVALEPHGPPRGAGEGSLTHPKAIFDKQRFDSTEFLTLGQTNFAFWAYI